MPKDFTEQTFEIHDTGEGDRKLTLRVTNEGGGLNIYAEGYGDKGTAEGHGTPVFLEIWEGRFRVHVWSDINVEDPTHSIDLEGALESNRKDKSDE